MKMIRPLAVAASLALVLAACGSDDDSSADTTTATPDTSVAAPDETDATDDTVSVDTTEAETVTTDAVPAGSVATLTVDDVVVEGTLVECSLEESTITFIATGDTSEMSVFPLYGTYVGLSVTGDFEFEGSGEAVIDGATVTITGSGALADPALPTTNYVLEADITSC